MADQKKPHIVMIMADDMGTWNLSSYHRGMMGGSTPNIDTIARDGALFTDYYGRSHARRGGRRSSPARVLSGQDF
jgi:arylsulfatase